MKEFVPKKKIKIFNREFMIKYSYVFVLAIILFIGTSYSLTFFTQNMRIATGSLTTAALNITVTDNNINASNVTVPVTDHEGLLKIIKPLTITNNGTTDGKVKLKISRTSGLNLSDLRYAIIVNGAIQEIDDVPVNGEILNTAIMSNEVINVEVRLWPKTDYSGSATTFVGTVDSEISYFGEKASNRNDLSNKFVKFNCQDGNCQVWRIVKVENGRLVLTSEADLEGASERTDSGKYNPNLTFYDSSMITSVSTDNKNVYLAKTVKIKDGDGSLAHPYELINSIIREPDKKIIATITYKNVGETVGTQFVYYDQTNYISQIVNTPAFIEWKHGDDAYSLGDIVNFKSDIELNASNRAAASTIGYDDTKTHFNCDDLQCAIAALYSYRH